MSDAGDTRGQYNDGNRAFLQAFLARGSMNFKEGQKVLAAIFTIQEGQETNPNQVDEDDFKSFISAAADAISPYDYEIRSTQDQITKERIYALVNSVSDPLTQLATTLSADELSYIKRLLDTMFETNNTKKREVMAVTGMQALETKVTKGSRQSIGEAAQNTSDKGLTQSEAEKLLERLVKETWLERSKEGFYTLSPRALMELRSWLVETYNDVDDEEPHAWQRIKFCEACKEIVTIGQRCSDRECNVRLHNICTEAFWLSRTGKTCPKCDTAWNGKSYVGQKAITSTDDYLKGKRRSGGKRKGPLVEDEQEEVIDDRRRASRRRVVDEEVEEEASEAGQDNPVEEDNEEEE